MLTEVKLSEIVGKTVAGIFDGTTEFIMSFTDGTWAAVIVEENGFDGPELQEGFSPTSDYQAAFTAGVINAEEHAQLYREAIESQTRYERANYDRLKAKFEGQS